MSDRFDVTNSLKKYVATDTVIHSGGWMVDSMKMVGLPCYKENGGNNMNSSCRIGLLYFRTFLCDTLTARSGRPSYDFPKL